MALFKTTTNIVKFKGKPKQGCEGCTHKGAITNWYHGQGGKEILVIVDHPSKLELKKDQIRCTTNTFQFFDPNTKKTVTKDLTDAYDYVNKQFERNGIDLLKDCHVVAAYPCCDSSTKGLEKHYQQCHQKINMTIKRLKPKLIIVLGGKALKVVLAPRLSGRLDRIKSESFIGECIPDQELNSWVCPIISPLDLEMSKGFGKDFDVVLKSKINEQIKKALSLVSKSIALPKFPQIEYMMTPVEAIDWLRLQYKLWEGEKVVFDLETSGLKSQGNDMFIACIAFRSKDACGTMPFFANDEAFVEAIRNIMVSPNIKMVAQNAQFEDSWMYNKSGETLNKYRVQNWYWDTMLAEHCINSKKPTGLKFQTYVHLGVLNYDGDVAKYLKSTNNTTNGLNRIRQAPQRKLLEYCALDTIFTYEAMERQEKWFELHPHLNEGNDFLLEGSIALSTMHLNGQCFDVELALEKKVALEREIRDRIKALNSGEYGKGWDGQTSGANIYKHVYKTLGLKNVDNIKTKKDKLALDMEVMEKMEHPFTDEIIKIKKLEKILGTYIESYLTEECKGKVHPFFKLHGTATFRSSSSNPNAQNIPKRNKKIAKIIRTCVRPSKNHRFMAWDYKALETIIAACNYPDTNWIEYVSDLRSDMHWDWSVKMLEFDEDFIEDLDDLGHKGEVRGWVKNQAVFPGIYGSSYNSIAKGLFKVFKRIPLMWDWFGERETKFTDGGKQTMGTWQNIKCFTQHMKEAYEYYWGVWFTEFKQLRTTDWEKYQKDGYTDTLNGFRYQGALGYTEFCNYKTQGPASHIKLWTLLMVQKEIEKRGLKSKLVWEIHDEIGADVYEGEELIMQDIVQDIGTVKVRKHWPWIIVPLVMDCECSELNGSWYEMKDIKKVFFLE